MKSISRSGLAGSLLALVGLILTLGYVSPAKADTAPFWEESDARPSLSGHRHAAARVHAARHHRVTADDDEDRPRHRARRHSHRVASLGNDGDYEPVHRHRSVGGDGGVTWAASSSCLNGTLVSIIDEVGSNYGPVTVNSTCRSQSHNAAVGGAHHSQHLTGDAVDFRVHGNISGAIAFLRSNGSVGGFKHYGGGLFHIDTGPRRTW